MPVEVHPVRRIAQVGAALELLDDVGVTGRGEERRRASRCGCTIPLSTSPAGMLPGQRTTAGTRKAPSQLVFFSLRNGVMPASGQVFMWGPLSVE